MRSLICRAAWAMVLVVVPAPAVAAVAPLSAALAVERAAGTEDCPDEGGLETLIARILGRQLHAGTADGPTPGDVRVLVQFTRTALGYQATLRLHGAKEGERTLTDTGPSCAALGRAVSITMALLLEAREAEEPEAVAPAVTMVAPPPPAPLPTATQSPRTTALFLALAGGPASGLVGALSVAGALALELELGRRARLRFAGEYVAPRATNLDGGSVDVALSVGRLGLCGVLNAAARRVRVAVCGEGAAGQLVGTGSGFPAARASSLTWLAAGGGLELTVPVGSRWQVGVRGAALAALRKYSFSLGTQSGGREIVYTADRLSGMLQLGVGVKIW